MKIEKKTFTGRIEVKLAGAETETATKSFSGYGAYFGNLDSWGDVIKPGAFKKSLAEHERRGTKPLMLLNHDAWDQLPVGVWKSMSEDENGLLVEGELLDTTAGEDVYKALKAGAITGLSIGFRVSGYEINGKSRTITEADLLEISVVTFPANDLARVADVKAEKVEDEEEVDDEPSGDDEDEDLKSTLSKSGFSDEAIEALFFSRTSEEEEVEVNPTDTSDDEESHDAKYDKAGVLAAIRKMCETTKEMYVR